MTLEFDASREARKLVQLAEKSLDADRKSIARPHDQKVLATDDRAHSAFHDELHKLSFDQLRMMAAADKRIHLSTMPTTFGSATAECAVAVTVDAFNRTKNQGAVGEQYFAGCEKKA